MHKIESINAYNSDIPGQPITFEVQMTVTVAHPGIEVVLVQPRVRHRGGWETLELQLIDNGNPAPQVVTEKNVFFTREGASPWKTLEIIHPGGSQRVEIGYRQAYN